MSLPPRTVADTIVSIPNSGLTPLPAPAYTPLGSSLHLKPEALRNVAFAVSSMKDHMTSEGWEIMLGLQSTGYVLCGHGVPGNGYSRGITDVQTILQEMRPDTLLVQDKREWDLAAKDFRDPAAKLLNADLLSKRNDVFKLTILKDAHQRPGYHRESAIEMGVHAWVIYYHPTIVMRAAPYLRKEHLIRTYHTTDKQLAAYGWLADEGHKRETTCLLSGALSSVYPLRKYCLENQQHIPGFRYLKHPGYHRSGSATPVFVQELTKHKVAICTSSMYGYSLRKIIEATAAGCIVITDLPSDEVLPYIDGNLVRIHPQSNYHDIYHAVVAAYKRWDLAKQQDMAKDCLAFYDYRSMGQRLAADIEALRRGYASTN